MYKVSLSGGSISIACTAANNDANGALTGSSGTQVYQQDSTVPSIAFAGTGYTPGTWTASRQTITVTATGGASGITGLSCTLDGNSLPDTSGDTETIGAAGSTQTAFVTVASNGAHNLACSADNAGTPSIVGSRSYQVDIDSQVPITSFTTGAGYAATSTQATDPQTATGQNWLNGSSTITIGLSGTEATIDSGVQSVTCTINGYTTNPVTLTNVPSSGTIASNTPFQASFVANPTNGWIDGQNVIACQALTPAGVSGANGQNTGTSAIEYVDVNDAAWPVSPGQPQSTPTPGRCGIASVIDNGGCAYSDGPSQTTWYSSSQTVRITADDTGAAAPITSITCSGVTMPTSSWTTFADPQDIDSNNGMTFAATVEAPGGKLDCSAADSASPIDTYELGTYNFAIDPDQALGHFEPQGYKGSAANIIQLDLRSPGGSGIKQVAVQATDENTGTVYTGGELTSNPADGNMAYATLDQNTGTWNLTVNPGVFPGVNDKIKLTATATTNAGVTATITTAENGTQEIVTPGQLGQNPTVVSGWSTTGDDTSITSTAKTGKWVAAGAVQTTLPASLNGTTANPVAPTTVATVAKWTRTACKAAPRKHKKIKRKSAAGRTPRGSTALLRDADHQRATGRGSARQLRARDRDHRNAHGHHNEDADRRRNGRYLHNQPRNRPGAPRAYRDNRTPRKVQLPAGSRTRPAGRPRLPRPDRCNQGRGLRI